MGYLAMMEYNYRLDPGYQPVAFLGGFMQEFWREKSPDLLSHRGLKNFQPSAECPMKIHGKNIPTLDVSRFHYYPIDQLKYGGIRFCMSKYSRKCKDSYQRILSSKPSFPQLQLGI
nr:hypothetical protein [Tanacetum cinerariifolium]